MSSLEIQTPRSVHVRIGITGHSNLSADTVALVTAALRAVLTDISSPVVGVSCLARGADQVFARAVLELGGELEVVLPAGDYRERKVKPSNAADFDELLGKASTVTTTPFAESSAAASRAPPRSTAPAGACCPGRRRGGRTTPAPS
jgi:hypothetical protein